jgi:hypothetical protein
VHSPQSAKEGIGFEALDNGILRCQNPEPLQSLAQILDRPLRGQHFFEEIIRDNLDLGRPDRVQLMFPRKFGSFVTNSSLTNG